MISHKIFKSRLNTKPFNYIHIEKLFDDKTVAKLIKKFPLMAKVNVNELNLCLC